MASYSGHCRTPQLAIRTEPPHSFSYCPLADPRASIAFLDPLLPTFDKPETREAFVLATMERSHFRLRAGEYDAAKEARDQCEKILDHLDAVDLAVHASFYRVSGDYYKVRTCALPCRTCTLVSWSGPSSARATHPGGRTARGRGDPALIWKDAVRRPRPSLPTTTATRSGTSPASMSRRTSPRPSGSSARTTSGSRRCSGSRSTTLESWCVFRALVKLALSFALGGSVHSLNERWLTMESAARRVQLMHPILDALKGTEHDFIRSLLFAFNAGDISKFQTIIPEMNAKEVRPRAPLPCCS